MSLEAIEKKILNDAREKSAEIENQGQEQKTAALQEAKKEAQSLLEQLLKQGKKEAEDLKKRALISASLEEKKRLLTVKREHLETIFKEVFAEIGKLKESDYRQLIEILLLKNLEKGSERVRISVADQERLGDGFLDKLKEKLKKQGKEGRVTFEIDTETRQGGFIITGKDVEVNCTFPVIIQKIKEEKEEEIARRLFCLPNQEDEPIFS